MNMGQRPLHASSSSYPQAMFVTVLMPWTQTSELPPCGHQLAGWQSLHVNRNSQPATGPAENAIVSARTGNNRANRHMWLPFLRTSTANTSRPTLYHPKGKERDSSTACD